jgi:hypothetical protein
MVPLLPGMKYTASPIQESEDNTESAWFSTKELLEKRTKGEPVP